MRNPFTNLWRKKSRRSTTRKRRSTFASTPLERLCSKHLFEGVLLFTGASNFLAQYSLRLHQLNNPGLARNVLNRSRLALFVANSLIGIESLVGDIHVDWGSHPLFGMPAQNLRMSHFQTDEHCENWTRFKKDELFDSIGRVGLE